MFGTIIITFTITALSSAVFFMLYINHQKECESRLLRNENSSLHKRMDDYYSKERARREKNAYSRGLYDGRETDTLYRRMLSKYNKGEQATVMMYGEDYGRDEK